KMINRLIEPSSGEIIFDGNRVNDVPPVELRRGIGYVIQGTGLFPHYTVAANIAVVPRLLGWSKSDIRDRVNETLELMNLPPDEYRRRYPDELSGGQKQRVGVARALAARSRVMLMDEPFGALDPITRDQLQEEFKRIQAELKLTAVIVTHDMGEALLMADRIAVMQGGELLQVGTPHELMTNPAHEYVEAMIQMPKRRADRLEALAQEIRDNS
ncbi:MAG: ABC transporter ATP-binding protein, partial [Anaerolineae bacterium]|nr:ABC transporter ATP-binding protein [Anaerolineae bacterium]